MYKIIQDDKVVSEYRTRQEADYYKKQYPKSKVITEYEICDLNKGLLAENTKLYAENPAKAIRKYIDENNLQIQVEEDLSNTGRFVITGNRTSKVYRVCR